MRFARIASCLVILSGILVLSTVNVHSQDKKDPPKVKGQLPPGWAKLDLSPVQKTDIYKIQTEYRTKIDKLEDEIKALRTEQQKKMVAVLTDEQKKKLLAGLEGTDPKDKDKSKSKDKDK